MTAGLDIQRCSSTQGQHSVQSLRDCDEAIAQVQRFTDELEQLLLNLLLYRTPDPGEGSETPISDGVSEKS